MVVSGAAIVLAGIVWRLYAGRGFNRTTLQTNEQVPYGTQRMTNVLMMVGAVWAGFGVLQWLS
jgi:hypothetical protein